MSVAAPVPLAGGLPRSLTDWLFVLYAAGVLAALVWVRLPLCEAARPALAGAGGRRRARRRGRRG